jgi:hypothetical protein
MLLHHRLLKGMALLLLCCVGGRVGSSVNGRVMSEVEVTQ